MVAILINYGVIIVITLSAVLLSVAFLLKNKDRVKAITVAVIAIAGAVAQLYLFAFNFIFISNMDNDLIGQHSITGIVENVRGTTYGTTNLQIRISDSSTLPIGRKISISDSPVEIEPGDEISCNIVVNNMGIRDLQNYIDGIFISSIFDGEMNIIGKGNGIPYFFSSIQSGLSDRIGRHMSEEGAGVAAAITYGDRAGLPYEIQLDFRSSGLSHVLVVSGLHLSTLCGLLLFVMFKITRNKYIVYPMLILIVIFYTLLCGIRLSIVRAAFVVIMLSISKLFSRRADSYTSLGLAVLAVTIINPYSSVDLSLLLSLFATVGIIYGNELWAPIHRRIYKFNRYLASVVGAALTSAAAILATMPVFAAIGEGFSLLSIPANLIVVLLSTPIIGITLLGIAATFLPTLQLAEFIFRLDELLIEILLYIAEFVSNIEWQFIHFNGEYPFVVLLIAFTTGFLVSIFYNQKHALLSGSIVAVIAIMFYYITDYNVIHVAVVGETQNPAIVLTKNTEASVIYRGTKSNNDEIYRYLSNRNIRKISDIIDISDGESSLELEALNIYNFDETKCNTDTLTIMDNISIVMRKQPDSNISLIDIAGFNLAISSGEADYADYGIQDLVVAGSSKQYSIETEMLFARKPSVCIDFSANTVLPHDDIISFRIRPNSFYTVEE